MHLGRPTSAPVARDRHLHRSSIVERDTRGVSSVSTVLLLVGGDQRDRDKVDELNTWLASRHPAEQLRDASTVEDAVGGYKFPRWGIYATSLNHADLDEVVRRVESIVWERPWLVQLLIQDEMESTFGVWMFDDARQLREVIRPRTYDGSPAQGFNAAWRSRHSS